jgi:hypothetical protein
MGAQIVTRRKRPTSSTSVSPILFTRGHTVSAPKETTTNGNHLTMSAAADTALETLQVWRKHYQSCKQCKADPDFCDTQKAYKAAFEKDYKVWERRAPISKS